MAIVVEYDCFCPICIARAKGIWPKFVAPEPDFSEFEIDAAARTARPDDPYKALGDRIDQALCDAILGPGFYP